MKKQQQWTIRNFRELDTNTRHCSEGFTINHCNWKLAVYRGEKDKKYLAVYLYVADASSLLPGWSIKAEFTLTVVNQSSRENSTAKVKEHTFREKEVRCGCASIMRLEELERKHSGFIRDNKCIVEVEFCVVKPARLVYFKDLGRIEEQFVPLLKEVFSWYPSLLDGKKNRTREFTEWAFNILGRVLKFLKEKKWKDMKDEKSRDELRHLWEELGKSGLDLRWLKPNVTSALNMEGYKTKAEKVELERQLKKLEKEKKVLEEKLRGIEESVKKTRKDLKNAERFKEKDLDAKIGYPKP